MRFDGRAWNEMRPVRMVPGFIEYAEGSVLLEVGETRVLCNATVEDSVPRWRSGSGAGWVEVGRLGGRTQEIRRLIGRSLRAAVDLSKLGERTIIVDCDVIKADGGTRTASITGGYVALALALQRLEEDEILPPGALTTQVAATSLGPVDGQLMLDLCYEEDSAATADFNVVMTGRGRLVEVQGTAEGATFERRLFDAVLDLAEIGIDQLLVLQRQVLGAGAGAGA
jgi:ribonuclease PH